MLNERGNDFERIEGRKLLLKDPDSGPCGFGGLLASVLRKDVAEAVCVDGEMIVQSSGVWVLFLKPSKKTGRPRSLPP